MLQASELYQLSQELSQKGPSQSELELRYLYQICLEAGLLGWCFLIAVVLHDGFSVIRIINPSRMEALGPAGVANLRRGLDTLNQWAETGKCPGYKPFLTALKIHTSGIFNGSLGRSGNNVGVSNGVALVSTSEEAESKLVEYHRRDVASDPQRPICKSPNLGVESPPPGRVTPIASGATTSELDQSHLFASQKNASASSNSTTTRSRSSTPVPAASAAQSTALRGREDCCASPELAFALMPSPDDVLMTSATSSRGFAIKDDDDDELNGNGQENDRDLRVNVADLSLCKIVDEDD